MLQCSILRQGELILGILGTGKSDVQCASDEFARFEIWAGGVDRDAACDG